MDPKTYVLENIPSEYGEDFVRDYVEGTLDIDVKEVKVYPFIQKRALISLEEPLTDFAAAAKMVQESKIASQTVKLLKTKKKSAVITHDVDFKILSKDFLQMYLESSFAAGEDVIETCETWPEYNVAVVHFLQDNEDVVSSILAETEHLPLPSVNCRINICPFYKNFHELIGKGCEIKTEETSEDFDEKSLRSVNEDSSYETAKLYTAKDRSSSVLRQSNGSECSDGENEMKGKVMEQKTPLKKKMKEETEDSWDDSEETEDDEEENEMKGKAMEQKKLSKMRLKAETEESEDDSEETEDDEDENEMKGKAIEQKKLSKMRLKAETEESEDDSEETEEDEVENVKKEVEERKETQKKKSVMNLAKIFDGMSEKVHSKDNVRTGEKGKHGLSGRGGCGRGGGKKYQRRGNLDRPKQRDTPKKDSWHVDSEALKQKPSSRENDSSDLEDTKLPSPTPSSRGYKNSRANPRGRGSACLWVSYSSSSNALDKYARKSSLQSYQEAQGYKYPRSQSSGNIQQEDIDGIHKKKAKSFDKAGHSGASKRYKPKPVDVEDDLSRPEENLEFKKMQKELEEDKRKQQLQFAKMEEELNKVKEENLKLKEAPKRVKETLEVSELRAKILKGTLKVVDGCTFHYDSFQKKAVVEGSEEVVRECMYKLLTELRRIKEDLFALSPDMLSLLSSIKGKKHLESFTTQLDGVHIEIKENALVVAAKDDNILDDAMKKLKSTLKFQETFKSHVKIPDEKIRLLQIQLQLQYLVVLSCNDDSKTVILEGFKDDVLKSKKEVESLIEECDEIEMKFCVKEPKSKFFSSCLGEKITDMLKDVEVLENKLEESKILIRFKGRRSQVNQILRNLQSLEAKVMSRTWDLKSEFPKGEDLMLLSKNLMSDSQKSKMQVFELTEKCLVSITLPDSSFFKVAPNKPKQFTGRHRKVKKRSDKVVSRPSTSPKLVMNITPTCQLNIKPYGDIIRETSDVLVCVLTNDVDLRKTRVGMAFNKTCPSLWKSLNQEKESNPGAPFFTTSGPFPKALQCQAICHIILTPWNASSSPAQLRNAVTLVLQKVAALGAKSVSFPALGCGRALKFPESVVAQTVLASIQSMSQSLGSINKIVLLAPDSGLFKEISNEAPKHFSVQQPTMASAPVADDASSSEDESEEDSADDDSSEETEAVLLSDSQAVRAAITLVTLHGNNLESLWSKIKKQIEKNCLHIDYFNQELMDFWPKESRQSIIEGAKKNSVWVERSSNPKTKKPGFMIKGEKSAVEKMKNFIHHEFLEVSQNVPKKRILSGKAKRGTVEFMIQASESDEPFPSYWQLNKSKSWWQKKWENFTSSKRQNHIVDVDQKTKDAITKLVAKTWDSTLVGAGNDAKGLGHSDLKVLDVKRIENPNLFEAYRVNRKWLFEKMIKLGKICPDIGKIPSSKGRVDSTEKLDSFMKEELYYEVNESYLFHGTKADTVEALATNGLDPKVSSEHAMFGKGIYAAEKSTKSDQYTDPQTMRSPTGTKLKLILARMLLGNVFLCNNSHPSVANKQSTKLNRPPCMHCLKDRCSCKNQTLFDSVMGDGSWLFREFVVYEKSHCYPEYIITYQRV